jgi:hypothetical protein
MATHPRSLSSPEGHRTQAAGPTADAQRHLLDLVQRCFLAGPSGALRSLAKRVPLVPHLDHRRGTFDRILERLQVRMRAEGLMDLDTRFIDSTHVRASRAAAGAKKGAVRL